MSEGLAGVHSFLPQWDGAAASKGNSEQHPEQAPNEEMGKIRDK